MSETNDIARRGTFARASVAYITGHLVVLASGLITAVVLARVLGPERRGILAAAVLLPTVLAQLLAQGLGSSIMRNIARASDTAARQLGNGIRWSATLGLAGAVIGAIVLYLGGDFVAPGVPLATALLALGMVPVSATWGVVNLVPLGLHRFVEYNALRSLAALAVAFGTTAALIVAGPSLTAAILGPMGGLVLLLIASVVYLARRRTGIAVGPDPEHTRQTMKYAAQMSVVQVITFLNYRADVLIVALVLGPVSVGLYAAAFAATEKLSVLARMSGSILFPRVARSRGTEGTPAFTALVVRVAVIGMALGGLVLFVAGPFLVPALFGTAFTGATASMRILIPGIVALGAAQVLGNDISARWRPALNAYVNLAGLVINIGLNLWWVPVYGLAGAAWASTASYTAIMLGRLLVFSRITGLTALRVVRPRITDLTTTWKSARSLLRRKVNEPLDRTV